MIKGQAYRLKLWSEDHINENVAFQARIIEAKKVAIDEMVRGTNFNAEKGITLLLIIASIWKRGGIAFQC